MIGVIRSDRLVPEGLPVISRALAGGTVVADELEALDLRLPRP